jgi:hypothetical protein
MLSNSVIASVLPSQLKAIVSTQMESTTSQIESTSHAASRLMLSSLDWRVWFLGYGLGGCFGLALLAGAWSLLVDENRALGITAIAISLAHFFTLVVFWLRRTTILARSATRVCYLAGALGIATVAWLMNSGESRVPGLASLYSLALMNFVFAFTVPLLTQLDSGRNRVAAAIADGSPHTT